MYSRTDSHQTLNAEAGFSLKDSGFFSLSREVLVLTSGALWSVWAAAMPSHTSRAISTGVSMVAMCSLWSGVAPGGGLPATGSRHLSGTIYMSSSLFRLSFPVGFADSGEGDRSTNLVRGRPGGYPPDPPAAASRVPSLEAGRGTSLGRATVGKWAWWSPV